MMVWSSYKHLLDALPPWVADEEVKHVGLVGALHYIMTVPKNAYTWSRWHGEISRQRARHRARLVE